LGRKSSAGAFPQRLSWVYLVLGEEKEFVHFENSFGWSERREDWE
jgi:hypothetical protein